MPRLNKIYMDLNKTMIIGRVTQDPELKTIPSGQSVVSFSVATNRSWTDKQGQKQDKAEFHNIVAWRKLAEIIGQYVKKGSKIYIEGRLETRSWEDQQGVKKYRTEIIADNMIMLDSKRSSQDQGAAPMAPSPMAPAQGPAQGPATPNPAPQASNPDDEISVEDIPF